EFTGFSTLFLGDCHGVLETGFGFTLVVRRQVKEEFAPEAVEFCFVEMLSSILDGVQRFIEHIETCIETSCGSMGFGEERQKMGASYRCSCGTQGAQTLLDLYDAFLRLPLLRQCPATENGTERHPEGESLFLRHGQGGVRAFLGSTYLTAEYMEEASTDEGRTETVGVCQVLCQSQRLIDPRQPLLR